MRVPTFTLSLAAALLLGACDAPPKPPAVNEATRRPANSAWVVDLQSCRSNLANTRIDAAEAARRADFAMATADRMVALQQAIELIKLPRPTSVAIASLPASREAVLPLGNSIYTVQFDYSSSRVNLAQGVLRSMLDQARTAPLVVLRGRTDGTQDLAVEVRIARERAQAVKSHLVAAGLDPNRIRTTWQPTGDHSADNSTPEGRAKNRRVEITLFVQQQQPGK